MTSKRPGRVGTKPAAARSLAYVLSQTAGPDGELRWHIVDRSGPGCVVKVGTGPAAKDVPLDDKRPDFEIGALAGALAAMEASAENRERFALALPGERHVLFLAVPATDLPDYGLTC